MAVTPGSTPGRRHWDDKSEMKSGRQSNRGFGLMFAAVFAVLGAVGWLAFDARPYWAAAVAIAFAILALAAPGSLLPLNRLWGAFARQLGHFNNYVLLGLFFYGFVFPVGLVMRTVGSDPMHRKLEPEAKSYWRAVERHTTVETFKDMF